MMKPLLTILVVVGLITACAETKVAKHSPQDMLKRDKVVGYKVGVPYKIKGKWYYPKEDFQYSEAGIASWYGAYFNGRPTANGETYDMNDLTAAHKTLPMPSMVKVTNLENGRSLKLRVNDRGPFVDGRIIDVSRRAAQLLGFHHQGIAHVKVDILVDESKVLAGLAPEHSLPKHSPAKHLPKATTASISPAIQTQSRVQNVTHTPASPPAQRVYREASAASAVAATAAGSAERERVTTPAEITPAKHGPAKYVYVQAGAFSYSDNAEAARAQLREVGPVLISAVQRDGRDLYRVRVGPLASADEADRLLAAVVQAGFATPRVVHE